jgi:hypothetical protein
MFKNGRFHIVPFLRRISNGAFPPTVFAVENRYRDPSEADYDCHRLDNHPRLKRQPPQNQTRHSFPNQQTLMIKENFCKIIFPEKHTCRNKSENKSRQYN